MGPLGLIINLSRELEISSGQGQVTSPFSLHPQPMSRPLASCLGLWVLQLPSRPLASSLTISTPRRQPPSLPGRAQSPSTAPQSPQDSPPSFPGSPPPPPAMPCVGLLATWEMSGHICHFSVKYLQVPEKNISSFHFWAQAQAIFSSHQETSSTALRGSLL